MALEDLLKAACERGLTHLTISPVHSEDRKTVYWMAHATPSTMHKYISVTDLDPVAALTQVLLALPKATKRPPPRRDKDMVDEVTAAVIPPAEEGDPAAFEEQPFNPAPHSVPDPEPAQSEIDKWLPKT